MGRSMLRLHDGVCRHDGRADRRARRRRGRGAGDREDAGRAKADCRAPPSRAQTVSAVEAALIAELIRRDLPYYDASISPDFVAGMNQFARDVGILKGDPLRQVVATQFSHLWA